MNCIWNHESPYVAYVAYCMSIVFCGFVVLDFFIEFIKSCSHILDADQSVTQVINFECVQHIIFWITFMIYFGNIMLTLCTCRHSDLQPPGPSTPSREQRLEREEISRSLLTVVLCNLDRLTPGRLYLWPRGWPFWVSHVFYPKKERVSFRRVNFHSSHFVPKN